MHLDPRTLRAIAIGLVILLLYGSRLTKGSVVQTAEGLVFRIKPLFAWSRAIALPAYVLFFLYFMTMQKQPIPWWMALLFIAAIAVGVMQMPGTITLTPMAITQSFWFQPSKTIQYNEVMAIQAIQGGRMTRILGDNRVKITHTSNHCAALEFQHEIERRTGKRVIA
jgi:succinate dehydrogenase/fumarate reductase cytochrome b subunit